MRKTTPILLRIFSALSLLVFVSVCASAQGYFVEGEIRWKKEMGVAPGDGSPTASPCQVFSIHVLLYGRKLLASTNQSESPFLRTDEKDYYVCRYSLKVPEGGSMHIATGIAGVRGPWIGGSQSTPPPGYQRGFPGATYVTLSGGDPSKRIVQTANFEMTYIEGPRASFAGVWQSNFGNGLMMLILQQTGDRVTGQLKVNSADFGVILDGKVVDNTLRFTVVRRDIYAPHLPGVSVGTGELVMDAGRKSFKGTVLAVATSGTLLGR